MDKLKVAVIGCGIISIMHLDSVVILEDSELVAVCDIDEAKAKKTAEKYNTKYYTDYKTMFASEKLDVVHICLPHYLHTVVSRDAFDAGINVISEKPMSINYDDAVKTVELAKEKNLQYGVIFQCRYNASSRLVKSRIEDGKLGRVKCARSVLTWNRSDEYYSGSDWKGTWEKEGGGVIINQAIHTLDLVNWMINDEVSHIEANLANRTHNNIEVEDVAEGMICYKNGARHLFYATNNYLANEAVEIRMECENGKVIFSSDEAVITYNDGTVEYLDKEKGNVTEYSGGQSYWGTQHATQIHQFYQAVMKKEPLEISGYEALKIQKIVCDIYNR